MEGTPCNNLQPAIRPLTINLPDGTKVKSTHTCDITIPGLPMILVGHVVPKLSIASLIGIRVLCDAGCEVVFTKTNCDVWYKGKIILRGKKDPSTGLWTLPIGPKQDQTKTTKVKPVGIAPKKSINVPADAHEGAPQVASFTHSIKKGKRSQVCTPVIVQPKNINPPQGGATRIP